MKHSNIDIHDKQRPTVGELLALTVPLASAVASIAWATAAYLMVREAQRARVEIVRIEAGKK